MADFLRTWIENSQWSQEEIDETLKLYDESIDLLKKIDSDEARKEFTDLRYSIVWALTDLRAETHSDLENIRTQLWEWWSVNVYSYAEGNISRDELWNIAREFSDLQELASESEPNPEDTVNQELLNTIKTTNAEIIAWWDARFNEEIETFKGRYWKLSIIQQISDTDYDTIVEELDWLKNLSWNIHHKLFKLSQVIYKANWTIWDIGKSMISLWYGSDFENTHNLATRDLIQKVIKSSDWNYAVAFNKSGGYDLVLPDTLTSASSELEIWTYLCSLNQSGNLNKDTLLSIFTPAELFVVLTRYKSWEFGEENVQWLFPEHLGELFKNNMKSILVDTIKMVDSTQERSAVVQSWLDHDPDTLNSILPLCNLCSRIDEYSYEDIIAMSDEELQAYQENESTRPFYEGLMKKVELHDQTQENIDQELTQWLQVELGEDIPEGLQQKISETSYATVEYMSEYLSQNPSEICSMDLKIFFAEDPDSPILELKWYVQRNFRVNLDDSWLHSLIDTTVNEWFHTQISLANTNIFTARARIQTIQSIPENERTETQNQELQSLENSIVEWEEDLVILKQKQERAHQIKTAEIVELNQEQIGKLREFMQDNNLSWPEAYSEVIWKDYDFSNTEVVEFFEKNPEHIRSIRNTENLIDFLKKSENKIWIADIHPWMRVEYRVVEQLKNPDISDINLIPDTYFSMSNTHDLYLHLLVLFEQTKNSNHKGIERLILTKVDNINITLENKNAAIEIIAGILTSWNDEIDVDKIIKNIPSAIFEADNQWLLNDFKNSIDWNNYNESDLSDSFDAVYQRAMNGGVQINPEEKDIIHNYFIHLWVMEKRNQFINLLKQGKIENKTLQETVPYISNIEIYKDIVKSGIQTKWIGFTELLPSSWHSDPMVIEETLHYYFNKPDGVDESMWRHIKSDSLEKAANILIIKDAPWLYAAYIGLQENKSLLWDLFWNKFDGNYQLEGIVNNAWETYTSKFTKNKVPIIIDIVREISDQKNHEHNKISQLDSIREKIQENIENINLVEGFLSQEFPDENFQSLIQNIISSLSKTWYPDDAYPIVATLLKETGIIDREEINSFYQRFIQSVEHQSTIRSAVAWEINFNKNEIWDFPENLLQTWENDTYEIGTNIIYTSREETNNAVVEDFRSYNFEWTPTEQAREYLSKHNISSDSDFWKALITVLINEETRRASFIAQQEPYINKIVEATIQYNAWNIHAYEWISEYIQEAINNGAVDLSSMENAQEVGKRLWITINNDGYVIFTESNEKQWEWETLPPQNNNTSSEISFSSIEERIGWNQKAPTLQNWDVIIPISQQEAQMLRSNPAAEKNLINMYDFFKNLNLLWVWEYREELITAVWEVSINLEDDSLREDELLRFGKKLLNIIQKIQEKEQWEDSAPSVSINSNISSLDSLNMQLSKFSWSRDLWWDDKSFNTYGDDRFESWMRNYGIIWWITFHTNKVREMMK